MNLILLLALSLQDPADLPDYRLRVDARLRYLRGSTQVRERDSDPNRLILQSELELDWAAGLRVSFAEDRPATRTFFEFEYLSGTGAATIGDDFSYDEKVFKAGQPFDSSIRMFFLRVGEVWKTGGPEAWAGPIAGIEYPLLTLGIDQRNGARTSEQFDQFLPYPVAGFAGGGRIRPGLGWEFRALGNGLPPFPTPLQEGGRLYMGVVSVSLEGRLDWRPSPGWAVGVGAGFASWSGSLTSGTKYTSGEDGNRLRLIMPELALSVSLDW